MPFGSHLSPWLLILILSLSNPIFSQPQSPSSSPNISQSSTESDLRELVEKYFALYAAKNLDGLAGLWSEKSPDFASTKQNLQQRFAIEDYDLSPPTISQVKIENGQTRLRAAVHLVAVNLTNKQKREERLVCNLVLIREEGRLKVWRYAIAEEDLAEALAKARSEQERAALLAEEKELITSKLAQALVDQGHRLFSLSNFDQAGAAYLISQNIAEQIGDKAALARALNSMASVHRAHGNYAQALEDIRKSLELSEALKDKPRIAAALNSLGEIHLDLGEYRRALEYFQKSLEMLEALGSKPGIARLLKNIGEVHLREGSYPHAVEYFQKSLALFEELENIPWIAGTLNSIGLVHCAQGNYPEALEYYRQSLVVNEKQGDKGLTATVLINSGDVFRQQGNYAQALDGYQKGMVIFESLGYKAGVASALDSIGTIHNLQDNYAQAVEYCRKSLALKESLGNKVEVAHALNSLGAVHASQGDFTQALECFQKSLAMIEPLGDKEGTARTLSNIGDFYAVRTEYAEALRYYRKSLALQESIGDKSGMAETFIRIGRAYEKQNRYAQALDSAERAAGLARQIGAADSLRRALFNSGAVYRAQNEFAQARRAFEEAIATTEMLRAQIAGGEQEQQRYFESKISPYKALVELLTHEGRPAEALTFAERAKARVLLDALQTGRVKITKATTVQEQEQERKLNNQLVSINTQIYREAVRSQPDQVRLTQLKAQLQKARLDFEDFQTNLYAAHPELRTQRGETQPLVLEEAGTLLPDAASALLEYVVTDDRTYLFIITKATINAPAEVRVYPLSITRDEIAKQIELFRRQLAARDLGFRASAAKLYALLLKPAQVQLRGKTNLIIAPDDKLWELPFQALLTGANRFLIEDAAIAYTPSLTVLREMTKRRKQRDDNRVSATLLALGNPLVGKETVSRAALTLRNEKLGPLPEAEQEVKALGRFYGTAQSKVYIGAEAREDRVKSEAGQARILHFATHGVLNNASPMYSHLVLAQGDTSEDGLLEAWELMQLDLKADLAVLSACETARGRFGAGEGMIGLSWALFIAGVPTTMVSQWKVESASTRDLMLGFHRQMMSPSTPTKPNVTKAEALRQAALKLMKARQTSHPFYWAGFVLIGNGS